MNDDLARLLSTLPEPMGPSFITANVMARIERAVVEQKSTAASEVASGHDGWTWLMAAIGITLVMIATASGWYTKGLPDVFSPRYFRGGLDVALSGWQASLVGAAGLALCLRALFAPLRSR